MSIGELIRDKRKYLKLSQQELADKIGVSKSAISRYESGQIGNMGIDKAQSLVKALKLDPLVLLDFAGAKRKDLKLDDLSTSAKIPVVGKNTAGAPAEAIKDIIDHIDNSEEWTKGDAEYIGLEVKGDSMNPVMLDGDRVVIHVQPTAETGDICACYVNGFDVSLKRIALTSTSITLKSENPSYPPKTYAHPGKVTIVGKVVEIRRKV